jgi:hypothetical protein
MAIPPVVVCRDDGVFDVDGTLLASISHRKVASSESYTYWSARGVADFSVLLTRPIASADGGMSIGAWWLIPGWTTPQPLFVDVAQGEADLVLRSSASVECRVIADRQSDQGCSYTVIDEDSRALATIEWSWPGWRCQMSSHVPMTTRRLVCIAALWAERRHKALQAG